VVDEKNLSDDKTKENHLKNYIEEGEFDSNGLLVLGRRIFDDATYEFVGEKLDKAHWKKYLHTFHDATWKEKMGAI